MTADFLFVHAADLHLGAPFEGIAADDPRVASALVEASYGALERLVDLCLERDADFLVLSGDCTNDRDPSLRAQLAFQAAMRRLDEAGIAVYAARGNHDPADGWSARLEMPGNVHVFSPLEVERVVHERDGRALCSVYGRSYEHATEKRRLATGFRRDAADAFAIGVLHANVGSSTEHADYAPCNIDDLRASGLDYWALGHIHLPGVVCESPLAVYPGSPQGLNPKEHGPHGCYVVSVTSGVPSAAPVRLASVVWEKTAVDVTDVESVDGVRAAVARACEELRESADGCAVVVRASLIGHAPVHDDLARPGVFDDLVADLRLEQMSLTPWVWIDRLADRTSPVIDLDALRRAEDLAGDVVRLADERLADPSSLDLLVGEAADRIVSAIGTAASVDVDAADVVRRAREVLLDGLLEEA